MKTMTVEEFREQIRAQAPSSVQACFVCPMCGTVQNMIDLIRAGAGETEDDVSKYIGFSCVGRFTHHKPPPQEKGSQSGCNWTLGGVLQLHKFEVVTDDGVRHPHFDLATPGQAAVHLLDQDMMREAV